MRHLSDGNIEGQLPSIRAVTVMDLSKVTRHDIAHVYDTVFHTRHLAGGGVLSYMHVRNGQSVEITGHRFALHVSPDGVVIVLGSA